MLQFCFVKNYTVIVPIFQQKMADLSQYTLPNSTDVCLLDCKTAFKNLTDQEKRYAHHVSQASWYGGLIVLVQVIH